MAANCYKTHEKNIMQQIHIFACSFWLFFLEDKMSEEIDMSGKCEGFQIHSGKARILFCNIL